MSDGDQWKCYHRYSAFHSLYEEVLRGHQVALPPFPIKDVGPKKELEQVCAHV